jgi:hypothetical protein
MWQKVRVTKRLVRRTVLARVLELRNRLGLRRSIQGWILVGSQRVLGT